MEDVDEEMIFARKEEKGMGWWGQGKEKAALLKF